MKVELDKYDFELIHRAICYFDCYHDGEYDKHFGKNASKINESFHYLYSLSQEHRK